MSWNLIKKTISDRWKGTAVFAAGLAAYVLFLCALFPTFSKALAIKKFLAKSYPQSLLKFFGVKTFDIASFNNYIVLELLTIIWVVIVGAFVIGFARYMIAGEMDEGTLELLLSQPIARWKVITSEGATLLAGIVGLVLTTVLSVFVFGVAFGFDVSQSGFLAFIPLGCAMFIAIAGYAIFFSAIIGEGRRAMMASAILVFGFYLLHFAAGYSRVVEKIDYIGIFHYYDPLGVLDSGRVPVRDVLVLLAFGVAFFVAAVWVFRRKDVT